MFGLALAAVLGWSNQGFPLRPNWELNRLKDFFKNRALAVLLLFFFLELLSGMYSDNSEYLLLKLRLRGPFLVLPLIFFVLPKFSRKQLYALFAFLSLLLFGQSVWILIQYFGDQPFWVEQIGQGKALPTPISHIRYSLLSAIACLTSYFLWQKKIVLKYHWEPFLYLFLAIFHFVFLHIFSVRSGLFSLYGTMVILLMIYALKTKNYRNVMIVFLFMYLIPVMAINNVSSLKKKVDYMKYEWKQFKKGEEGSYSDVDRLRSLQTGLQIIKENLWLGVGSGDSKDAMAAAYKQNDPGFKGEIKLPHNQFMTELVSGGILALCLFLIAFFVPIFHDRNYLDTFIVVLCSVVFTSFLFEDTLESSVGTAIYVFFLCFILNTEKSRIKHNPLDP